MFLALMTLFLRHQKFACNLVWMAKGRAHSINHTRKVLVRSGSITVSPLVTRYCGEASHIFGGPGRPGILSIALDWQYWRGELYAPTPCTISHNIAFSFAVCHSVIVYVHNTHDLVAYTNDGTSSVTPFVEYITRLIDKFLIIYGITLIAPDRISLLSWCVDLT